MAILNVSTGLSERIILDAYLFDDIDQVQQLADEWMEDYNYKRPHEALGGLTPDYFKQIKQH